MSNLRRRAQTLRSIPIFSSSFAVGALLLTTLGFSSPVLPQSTAGDLSKVQTAATLTETAEALAELPDGSILFSANFTSSIMKRDPDGKVEEFAKLPGHTQVVIVTKEGFLATAHERLPAGMGRGGPAAAPPPAPAPGAAHSSALMNLGTMVVVLDKDAKVVKTFPGPPTSFFNGITQAGKIYLIADSIGGAIWQFTPAQGVSVWLKDDQLAPLPGGRGFPGANGIKFYKGWVYATNTTRGEIYRIRIGGKGQPEGELTEFATVPGADDFDIAKNGTIYIPSGQSILKISPEGEVSTFLAPVQGGATAMISHDQHTLYWGTRGPVPGGTPPANGAPGPGRGGPSLILKAPLP